MSMTHSPANLDRLSAVGNFELNAEIYSSALAGQMDNLFAHDTTNATELTLEDWSARPWLDKVGERILAPFRVFL